MKIPEVGWSQCDADKWVWNQIKPLPKEMKVKCPGDGVIDNWRRSQRRQRKTPSLQSLWVEVEFDQEIEWGYPPPAATPLVRKVELLRDLGYGAEQIAISLLEPFHNFTPPD